MKPSSTRAARSVVYKQLVGAIAGLTVLSTAWSGAAVADTGQDGGADRNQSRRQADRSSASGPPARQDNKKHAAVIDANKVESVIRGEFKDFAVDVDAAAAVRDQLEDLSAYVISPAAQQAALGPGGAVPTVGMGGLVPNARALAAYVATTYPGVQAIGGVRSDPLPDHPSGRAIDIMIGSDMGLGDAINADIQSQVGRFGVAYTLWRVANHYNHVHVTVS